MHRRELSKVLFATASGAALVATRTEAQTCTPASFCQTADETAAAVTPSNLNVPSHFGTGIIYAARYYAGSGDYSVAITNALKVAAQLHNSTVVISGAVSVAATNLPFNIPANTRVSGIGAGPTTITVTGTAAGGNVFSCPNVSNVELADLMIIGNSQANSVGTGGAIGWTGNLSTELRGFRVLNCTFQNFKGDYWVFVQNLGTAAMRDMKVEGCTFISQTGNARQPTAIGADSSCIGVFGSGSSLTGTVENINILGNTGNCQYIKSLFVAYQSTKFHKICDNDVLYCGLNEVADDCGAYGIMLYDSSGFQPPSRWAITGNTIITPRSCGIYLASAAQGSITGNTISGQYDQVEATLPKGGVVLNAARRVTISGNNITDCFRSVSLTTAAANLAIKGNILDSSTANAIAVRISGGAGFVINDIDVSSNSMNMTGATSRGVFIQSMSGSSNLIDQILISDNKISATYTCVEHFSPDSSYNAAHVRILGNKLWATRTAILYQSTVNPVTISNNVFAGNPTNDGCDVTASTAVAICNNVFEDFFTSYAMKTSNTRGEMWGNSFVRGNAIFDPAGGGEILGTTTPTWAGVVGMKVQTGYFGEAGVAGSKYLTLGWLYSGASWLPLRTLDGN